jgi:hypothetical protein
VDLIASSALLERIGEVAAALGGRGGGDPFGREAALARESEPRGFGGEGWSAGCGCLPMRGAGRGGGGVGLGTIALRSIDDRGPERGTGYGAAIEPVLRERASGPVPRVRACAGPNGERRACVVTPGGLEREVVRRVVTRHRNEIEACYEGGLARRADLAGMVELTMVISSDGSVRTSAIGEATLGDSSTEQCIAMAARRWTFPSSDTLTVVRWPYVLSAAGS